MFIDFVFMLAYSSLLPCVFNHALIPLTDQQVQPKVQLDISSEEKGQTFASKWPTGIISYYFDVKSYDFLVSYKLRMNMNILESISCIRFVPLLVPPEENETSAWIHIKNPMKERECSHEIHEYENGENVMVLGYECLDNVGILHSLLHAIGFHDEVTHPYRDKYIRVEWNNIQPRYRKLYNVRRPSKPDILVEYDPMSVMQFADRDYSANGRATVEPLIRGMIINPSRGLSQLDQMKLNLYFDTLCQTRQVGKIFKTCKNTLYKVENRGKTGMSEVSNDKYSKGESSGDNLYGIQNNKKLNQEASQEEVDKSEQLRDDNLQDRQDNDSLNQEASREEMDNVSDDITYNLSNMSGPNLKGKSIWNVTSIVPGMGLYTQSSERIPLVGQK